VFASDIAAQNAQTGTRSLAPAPLDQAWRQVSRSIANLQSPDGRTTGLAVLIDNKGLFLAHQVAVSDVSIQATIDGRLLSLKQVASDDQTQLVALLAENWQAGEVPVVGVAQAEIKEGETLLTATVGGPVQSELVANDRAGVMKPSLRYTPLQELNLERTTSAVGGALVFNRRGELVGVLGATLEPIQVAKVKMGSADSGARGGVAAPPGALFGPQGLTVGYALGPNLINRVVKGFRSPDRKVEHPSIGVFFKGSTRQGALIELVKEGSPAAKADIRVGDLVTEANGRPIRSPVDFAVFLFNQDVGQTIQLRITRGDQQMSVTVAVGSMTLLSADHSEVRKSRTIHLNCSLPR